METDFRYIVICNEIPMEILEIFMFFEICVSKYIQRSCYKREKEIVFICYI